MVILSICWLLKKLSTLTQRNGGPKATRMTKTGRKPFDKEEFDTAYHVERKKNWLFKDGRGMGTEI